MLSLGLILCLGLAMRLTDAYPAYDAHRIGAIVARHQAEGVAVFGCRLKAFRREAYLELPWFDHIHRFMPAIMLREGWRGETVDVTHRERGSGRSNYNNLHRGRVGIPDLLGAAWLITRKGPPRHE